MFEPSQPQTQEQPTISFVQPNFAFGLLTCVQLHLWFYNMLLKFVGICWDQWAKLTTKLVVPKRRETWTGTFQDTFDKDNPAPTYSRPRKRSDTGLTNSKWCLLAAFGVLSAASVSHNVFQLQSETQMFKKLRKYRGFQGMLNTARLPEPDLKALRQVIHLTSDSIEEASPTGDDSFTAIVDSGCSLTCTNSKHDFLPGTLKELSKPLTLGGIAGGLEVKYEGIVSWETVDEYGNIVALQTKAYLQEQLPCRLFSPQAFLKHSSQKLNDHFRVYCDRAELHHDGS